MQLLFGHQHIQDAGTHQTAEEELREKHAKTLQYLQLLQRRDTMLFTSNKKYAAHLHYKKFLHITA